MSPMFANPAGGESNTTLCATPELFVNDTVVPFATVRVVGEKLDPPMQKVLAGQVLITGPVVEPP